MKAYRKFRNKPVEIDGYRFHSQKEGKRYVELTLMQRAGQITGLCCDKTLLRYALVVNGMLICQYEADFRYSLPDGTLVIEDTKGVRTLDYVIKKKLMNALFDIQIHEV